MPIYIDEEIGSVSVKEFFTSPFSNYRITALRISLFLFLLALLFGFSISAYLFGRGIFPGMGSFFIQSYGVLALIIPAYLIYAAVLLADRRYKPDLLFILACIPLPFFTMAIGLYAMREFDFLALRSPFLLNAGRVGIGFLAVTITAMEVFLIILLRTVFFFPAEDDKPFSIFPGRKGNFNKKFPKLAGLLPAPKYRKLKDIYTESAAANSHKDNEPPFQKIKKEEAKIENEPVINLNTIEEQIIEEQLLLEELSELPSVLPSELPSVQPEKKVDEDADVKQALAEAEEKAARHVSTSPVYTPKRKLPYFVPVEGILNQYPDGEYWIIDDATRNAAHTLKETLKEFNIQADVTGIKKGPVITMFEILPAPGVKLSRIVNLQDNIALRLAASSVRIVAPIPGKHAVGIEVPNARRNIVSFREIIEGELLREDKKPEIPIVLGKDITGEAQAVDLITMPHLLIAGATGSGKSVCVNSMILSILYQKAPTECRLILIDPKIVELKLYNEIPHLLTPVITEPKKAFQALQYCISEMERRYSCLDSMGVRDIRSYNKRIKEREMAAEHMPYIVVVIDEFADLMATTGKEMESTVARLAAMSRAVGVHLVLATQLPSIDVITGLIKANIPSRIAFMVAGRMNSQIIIDSPGAEKLLGRGDMLYAGAVDPFPVRMQGAFVSEEEVERVVDYVKTLGEPEYIDEEIFYDDEEDDNPAFFSEGEDPLYDKALEIVLQQGKASASYIQRRLKIGYNRAARLVEEMEHHGVVGPAQGSKPREILRGYNN